MNPNLVSLAQRNWRSLTECSYFGRLIIAGVSNDGEHVYLATAISGRSSGSRNRRYIVDRGTVRTDVVDPSLGVGDRNLTLYPTQMENRNKVFVISNGSQTGDALSPDFPTLLGDTLSRFEHEPDKPNYTNRITARCRLGRFNPSNDEVVPLFEFAIHSPTEYGTTLISSTKPEKIEAGYSMFLATYDGNGEIPLRFDGGPRILPTQGIGELQKLVDGLSACNDFLVAVSFKTLHIQTGRSSIQIWNRHGNKPKE